MAGEVPVSGATARDGRQKLRSSDERTQQLLEDLYNITYDLVTAVNLLHGANAEAGPDTFRKWGREGS